MARPRGTPEPPTPPEPDARERLIAAGYRVLSERGYDATTVKEVAREAGVNQGLVHYYFGSKDGLLLAVTAEARRQYEVELKRLREEMPMERLATASFSWGERLMAERPEQVRLRHELYALGLRNPELKLAVAQLLDESDAAIAQTVAHVRHGAGSTPDAVDVQYAAIVRACFDGLSLHHQLDSRFDPGPAFALLRRIVLASLGGGPEGAKPPARKVKARSGGVPARPRSRGRSR
ncbi:TetR/AcrR family transcriptional regulator [Corallococcus sp. H22C18031201]|uniref:TetR/AcrR family transcriptional regulator n=1 Tax=Citreicoccus inhibens TaxID=2849499 RepID=UPI000E729451|nr:TetR/AcrR family transcriptional regulator [Citreicoccus inhibens]MBU8896046.1 TetR/AcrR family transcriptional regulator [Citreicoccus inhibens]RJS25917.1 TetR/AcrR family transcriptional regulator [Corallococcus sp. H22C18031201]